MSAYAVGERAEHGGARSATQVTKAKSDLCIAEIVNL